MTKWFLVVLSALVAACTTIPLTPNQSAGLKEAQRFADEVTSAYGADRVNVMLYTSDRSIEPSLSWGRHLSISPIDLDRVDLRETMVPALAAATLYDYTPLAPTAAAHRRQWAYDLNRRVVEISVRFLGIPTPQAVETRAAVLVRLDQRWRGQLPQFEVTPCDQLRDLWSHFAMIEPMPACDTGVTAK
jgi:hypothetical protein